MYNKKGVQLLKSLHFSVVKSCSCFGFSLLRYVRKTRATFSCNQKVKCLGRTLLRNLELHFMKGKEIDQRGIA